MRLAVFAFLLTLPFLAACDDSTSGPPEPQEAVTVTTTSGLRFSPGSVELLQGGVVTWNFNNVGHNVTFSTQGSPGNIITSFSTQTSRTFPNTGTYNYRCTIHQDLGMTGTINVR